MYKHVTCCTIIEFKYFKIFVLWVGTSIWHEKSFIFDLDLRTENITYINNNILS